MKTLALIFGGLLLAATTVFAQGVKPVAKQGVVSLNFTFGGLGNFGMGGSGISGGFGMSYFLNDDAALRIGMQGRYSNTSIPWNDQTKLLTNPGIDGAINETRISLAADHLTYMKGITERVKPFFGFGVKALFVKTSRKEAVSLNFQPSGTLMETRNMAGEDGWTMGMGAILGAEYFVFPEISISAEYDLNVVSLTTLSDKVEVRKDQDDTVTKRGTTLQLFGFGSGGATIHIYF